MLKIQTTRSEAAAPRTVQSRNAFRATSRSTGFRASLFGLTFATATTLISGPAASGETFTEASTKTLTFICDNANTSESTGFINLQSNLLDICESFGTDFTGSVFSALSASTSVSPQSAGTLSIAQRLQSIREAEEKKPEGGAAAGLLVFNGRSGQATDVQEVGRVPARGGPTIFGLGKEFSVFLSAGGYSLNHHRNKFEDGYSAQIPTVTIGADYRIGERFLAGLAFNYTHVNGNNDDGGGFNRDLFSPLIYATIIPFEGAFVDTVIGYTREDNSYRRNAEVFVPDDGSNLQRFAGDVSADYNGNAYTAGALFGYDYQVGVVTIGPRIGVDFAYRQTDNFEESGDTGLELKYRSLNRTSVQSSLGARGAITVPIESGVFVPQVTASWVHEYADNARNIEAQYIEASPSPSFTFKREPPARNWATIDAGIVYQPYGSLFQAFANFSTIQGNNNFVSYGGTIGTRIGF